MSFSYRVAYILYEAAAMTIIDKRKAEHEAFLDYQEKRAIEKELDNYLMDLDEDSYQEGDRSLRERLKIAEAETEEADRRWMELHNDLEQLEDAFSEVYWNFMEETAFLACADLFAFDSEEYLKTDSQAQLLSLKIFCGSQFSYVLDNLKLSDPDLSLRVRRELLMRAGIHRQH